MNHSVQRTKTHPTTRSRGPHDAGFTLIEIIAVVAIMAMVFAIGIPRLGVGAYDPLEDEAEQLAQSLRFARQRAIMTGVPHRVLVDLEEGGYLTEWYVSEDDAFAAVGGDSGGSLFDGIGAPDDEAGEDTRERISLVPNRDHDRNYYPIPHRDMGTIHWIDDALYFVGVEGAAGWVESGEYAVIFYTDGTTASALLEVADADGRHLTLEIEAIQERVRLRKGAARS